MTTTPIHPTTAPPIPTYAHDPIDSKDAGDNGSKPSPIDIGEILAPKEIPFARGADDSHTVDPNDIQQGGYGSCALLSTLHTIAQQDPTAIQNMIKDNGDGTYTVTFQEKFEILGMTFWRPVEVNVSGPFNAGGAHPGDSTPQGVEVWPAIIEKAYVQQFHPDFATAEAPWPGNKGVLPGDVMMHLLGANANTTSTGDITSSEMASKLGDGNAVVAWTPGFKGEDGNWLPEITAEQRTLIDHYGISGGHAYAVSEIIPAGTPYTDPHTGETVTAPEDIVVLDNPWGSSDVVMPYSDYQKVYGWVSTAPTS